MTREIMSDKEQYLRWKAFGNEIKEIENRLVDLACNKKYHDLTSVKLTDALLRAMHHIKKFKCAAENRMFEKVNPPPGNDHIWFDVFYGERKRDTLRDE